MGVGPGTQQKVSELKVESPNSEDCESMTIEKFKRDSQSVEFGSGQCLKSHLLQIFFKSIKNKKLVLCNIPIV